jgi:hypothetical protein
LLKHQSILVDGSLSSVGAVGAQEIGPAPEAGASPANAARPKELTPQEIWDGIGVSKQGALDLLHPLMKTGVVKRVGTRKSRRYVLA